MGDGIYRELIAPCGMNCAICSSYLSLKNNIKNKGIRIPYCEGCIPRGKKCALLKKGCDLLLQKKYDFVINVINFRVRDFYTLMSGIGPILG